MCDCSEKSMTELVKRLKNAWDNSARTRAGVTVDLEGITLSHFEGKWEGLLSSLADMMNRFNGKVTVINGESDVLERLKSGVKPVDVSNFIFADEQTRIVSGRVAVLELA